MTTLARLALLMATLITAILTPATAYAEETDAPGETSSETSAETDAPTLAPAVTEAHESEPAPTAPADDAQPSPTSVPEKKAPASQQLAPQAVAAASGYFTSPAAGATFNSGQTITFGAVVDGTWHAEIWCDNGTTLTVDWSQPYFSMVHHEIQNVWCGADLYGSDGSHLDSRTFYVRRGIQANIVSNLSADRATFYPRVRDGYWDNVRLGFGARGDARVIMTIRNSAGRIVRSVTAQSPDPWSDYYWRSHVTWNGRNNAGSMVPVGRYRVTFTSSASHLRTATASIAVNVATGYKTFRRTSSVDGWEGSIDKTAGNCMMSEHYYPHGNHMDCWGGRYAQATYNFRIPPNARITGWFARGTENGYCCERGRITKTAARVRRTLFRVVVRITGWEAYVVTRAGVSYRYRARV